MKTMLALFIVSTLTACAGLSVPDALAKIDKLNLECHGAIDKLNAKGVVTVNGSACDKAAGEARDKLVELLDKLRAELAKAGV